MKVSIRSMFVAPKDKILISADLSQAESWVVAHLSQDRNMQWSLNNSDIHTDSGAALTRPESFCVHSWKKQGDDHYCTKEDCGVVIVKTARYIGKQYNHASAYRMKPPRAAQQINKNSDKPPFVTVTVAESKLFSERWHSRYNVKGWWAEIEQKLNETRSLTTVYGRKRVFYGAWGDELFREATAHEPQSTVADHFNGAIQPEVNVFGGLLAIYRFLVKPYKDRKIIQQGHDSFIGEVPKQDGEEFCQDSMRLLKRPLIIKNQEFIIPVDGEIGERWGEMEARKLL